MNRILLVIAFLFMFSACSSNESGTKFEANKNTADLFDSNGFDKEGYNREGFNEQGFNRDGFNKDGFDQKGFDEGGFDHEGFNEFGYDNTGTDRTGFKPDLPNDCEKDSITFEDMAGQPSKLELKDQYRDKYGVSFSLSDGKSPVLLKHYEGDPDDINRHIGWVCSTCIEGSVDWPYGEGKINSVKPEHKSLLGNYSLAGVNQDSFLIVDYDNPVNAASGMLIDVNKGEEFTFKAYDVNGLPIAELLVDDGAGDGLGTRWQITSSAKAFVKLEIHFALPGAGGGFALDNFSPSKACTN